MCHFIISGFSDEIDENIRVQFESIKELGIDYFEVRGVNGKNIADISNEELQELKNEMQKYGVKASSIGSPIGKVLITDDFEEHFNKFKWIVQIATALETKYIRMFSFYLPKEGQWETYREEVFARLSKMIAYAEEKGIVLLHENEKDIYGDTPERCIEFFAKLQSPNFRAVFDPANFVQCGENAKEAFLKLEPYIEYIHIKDAKEDGTVVPAGNGAGEIPFILKALKEKGYHGFVSLEPHLGSFAGLENLELDDTMLKLEKSSKKTFALAYHSLKTILERI